MRITKINIPKSGNDGLEDIKMDKLGQVVLLAGKNGSGKTRIIKKIIDTLAIKPTKNSIYNFPLRITNLEDNIKILRSAINSIERGTKNDKITETVQKQIESYKNTIYSNLKEIREINEFVTWNLIDTDEFSNEYKIISFVPKQLLLKDCNELTKKELFVYANNTNKLGIEYIPQGTLAKIQFVQNNWFNATHQNIESSEIEKSKAIENYKKLKDLIKIFLDTNIGRNLEGDATIFGFPLGQARLSDGQKILLQFCLALYSQEVQLKDLILILDEPENHLHPSVIIETFDRIMKCIPNGQIWIATHSVPLLAHFDPSLIWYVDHGKVSWAGKIPEKVLSGLLGNDDEIAKLQEFVSLPAQFATTQFAFECLFEPKAVETGTEDKQIYQIRKELLELTKDEKIRILDFGAGKGRLISNIADLDITEKTELIKNIDYIALDNSTKDKEYCENIINNIYGESKQRYFNKMKILLSKYDKNSFNVIVMCNVLHEIEFKDWLNLFKEDGEIPTLLKEDGILLLVEDHQLPTGEKAYQKGFLVLDTPQIKDLFKISEKDIKGNDWLKEQKDGRLKAHKIKREWLIRIDSASKKIALESLSKLAQDEILKIRSEEKNYKNGKIHAFWVQQFANAQLSLSEFSK